MTTTPRTILPPSSTTLERVIDTTFPRGWGAMADGIEPAAVLANDSFLPWVAQQWQISRFDRYFDDTRELIAQGLPWLRERGTAAGVRRVLSWLGYTSVTLDEDGARLHINPGREVSNADIARMAYAVRNTIPLHVSFYRVFYRYDLRMLRWDNRPLWDAAIWDNVSGAPVDVGDDGGVVIGSQAVFQQSICNPPKLEPLQCASEFTYISQMRRPDVMRWDVSRWDGAVHRTTVGVLHWFTCSMVQPYQAQQPQNTHFEGMASQCDSARTAHQVAGAEVTFSGECTPRVVGDRKWRGRWDSTPWRVQNIQSNYYETTE
ncbi:phage tail protein [Diaphorobacter sp. HDW4A]|uniref:phage tail protein n=1 Tax=Diaphorobacter sp. HDW4A TaxID=2714924 RepID=UPI001408D6ED|nr:phage tail protein [Diaphorobacter sp. HDW4A]QIL80819.1 phage tail protein [Diaphorobacter sp. HDW4A]QIL83584.1 phage tail protein [Diaphorobacter sp. HDW4A]